MATVFISYNHENIKSAKKLVTALEKRGFDCWIDYRDIPGGIPFDDAIPTAIMTCDVVVMMLDQTSQNSKHLKNELRLAVGRNKNVIPFMLEDVELIEAFDYNISANSRIFSDKNWDDAIEKLVDSVNKLCPSTEDEAIEEEDTETSEIIRILQMLNVQCPKCQSRNYLLRHDKLEKYIITEGKQARKKYQAGLLLYFAMSTAMAIMPWIIFMVLPHEDDDILSVIILSFGMGVIAAVALWELLWTISAEWRYERRRRYRVRKHINIYHLACLDCCQKFKKVINADSLQQKISSDA